MIAKSPMSIWFKPWWCKWRREWAVEEWWEIREWRMHMIYIVSWVVGLDRVDSTWAILILWRWIVAISTPAGITEAANMISHIVDRRLSSSRECQGFHRNCLRISSLFRAITNRTLIMTISECEQTASPSAALTQLITATTYNTLAEQAPPIINMTTSAPPITTCRKVTLFQLMRTQSRRATIISKPAHNAKAHQTIAIISSHNNHIRKRAGKISILRSITRKKSSAVL